MYHILTHKLHLALVERYQGHHKHITQTASRATYLCPWVLKHANNFLDELDHSFEIIFRDAL